MKRFFKHVHIIKFSLHLGFTNPKFWPHSEVECAIWSEYVNFLFEFVFST